MLIIMPRKYNNNELYGNNKRKMHGRNDAVSLARPKQLGSMLTSLAM